MYWKKLSHTEIDKRVSEALEQNIGFRNSNLMGVPGTFLDENEFYPDAPFLDGSPYLRTFISNPNHIGCHTFTKEKGEPFFQGTQQLEIEVIKVCSEQILGAEEDSCDGYIAPGGTEANIQAMWVYRNYFANEFGASFEEIAMVYSADSHYSMPKGANILGLKSIILPVGEYSRAIDVSALESLLDEAVGDGIKHFIVIQNMSTTMFGSVDDIDATCEVLNRKEVSYKLHVDAAFGGFIYPFTSNDESYSFKNPNISSFTLDGHKMLQTHYGTGIFLMRKGLIQYVETEEAKYVHGKDYTICGSRSGANAVNVWMILMIHGSEGWRVKMQYLLDKTDRLCAELDALGVKYFRNPHVNIVTMRSEFIPDGVVKKYGLIPDNAAGSRKWVKIVMMQHVQQGTIDQFIIDLKQAH